MSDKFQTGIRSCGRRLTVIYVGIRSAKVGFFIHIYKYIRLIRVKAALIGFFWRDEIKHSGIWLRFLSYE